MLSTILSECSGGIEYPALLLTEAANSTRTAKFGLLNNQVASGDFLPELFVGGLQLGELLLSPLLLIHCWFFFQL